LAAVPQQPLVDIDDVSTWPASIKSWTDRYAHELQGSTECTGDLAVPLEKEDEFRALFADCRLRAIHCTRLLAHERTAILAQGLRSAGLTLVNDRILGAHAAGALTDAERDEFIAGHVFADGRKARFGNREHQVCFIASRATLDRDRGTGVERLLSTWGGEVIYFPLGPKHGRRLKTLGVPSLVVAQLDIAAPPRAPLHHHFTPPLGRAFVGARLSLQCGADVFYRAPVPQQNILAILQPGDAEYDRHRYLPQQ